jgi:hypothetical protein
MFLTAATALAALYAVMVVDEWRNDSWGSEWDADGVTATWGLLILATVSLVTIAGWIGVWRLREPRPDST